MNDEKASASFQSAMAITLHLLFWIAPTDHTSVQTDHGMCELKRLGAFEE